jgi:AcrR family transcriptional regulator
MTKHAVKASPSIATREKILDAAEILFIERGFAATSLRAIASKARVNLAATNYHFDSKNGLLAAVFHRRVAPINEQRLSGLKQLTEKDSNLTTRKILEVFFRPFMQSDLYAAIPAVAGWIYSEPEAITRPLLENEFAGVAGAFQTALASVLPHVSSDEMQWRFHFMVGSQVHLLRSNSPPGIAPSRASFLEGLEHLINFSIAGLEQASVGEHDD